MKKFNFENLSKLVGQELIVVNDQDIDAKLKITEVNPSKNETEKFEAFSVHYKGAEHFMLKDGEFDLFHESLGTHRVYIYNHGPTDYQTSISRLKNP